MAEKFKPPAGFRFDDEEPPKALQPPAGFKFDEEPGPDFNSELPPGYSLVGNQPAVTAGMSQPEEGPDWRQPAVNAGIGTIPEDPFERAAMRTRESVMPQAGRQEGALTAGLEQTGQALGTAAEGVAGLPGEMLLQTGKVAKQGFETGIVPPQQIVDTALMTSPQGVARGTGRAIARNMMTPAQRQQLEVNVLSIPKAAEGGVIQQAMGRGLASAPIGGGSLRKAAERSTAELKAAGEAASARPTGVTPTQNLAGSNVRRGIQASAKAAIAEEEPVNKGLIRMLGSSNEDLIGKIAQMSMETKAGANVNLLQDLRKAVPTRDWGNVQGALIDRMSRSPRTGEYDPVKFVSSYGNMSDRSKNIIFGKEGSGIRYHLDSLEGVARRAKTWQQFERERATLGSKFGAGSLITLAMAGGGAYMLGGPLAVLGAVIPMSLVTRAMSRPITAAPLAQWSTGFERVVRSGGGPQAIAAFRLSTRNLANTLGVDLDADTFLKGPQNGQPVE